MVSTSGKEKKPGPLEGLSQEERLSRYSTLFTFSTEEDIDANVLVEQWNASKMGIMAMINQAKNNKTLYDEMRSIGYEDEEFPSWWYSPARSDPIRQEQSRLAKTTQDELPSEQMRSQTIEPIPPRTPGPIEAVPLRPSLSGLISSDGGPSEIIEPHLVSSSFSSDELNLLASRKIYRSPESGAWFHREEYPDGRLMITPVNPNAELRRLREVGQDVQVMNKVRESMMSQLEITTRSIIKKVALNPSVFWTYSYVTSVRDPDEGVLLFDGDLGDFVSFCVKFTGEAYFGVVPTIMTNRPSMLTSLRNSRKNPGARATRE